MTYNFIISPRSGKTYFEENQNWKYIKKEIKNILDEKHSSRYIKIIKIQGLLDYYKEVYYENSK